jgi:hypothetical protein
MSKKSSKLKYPRSLKIRSSALMLSLILLPKVLSLPDPAPTSTLIKFPDFNSYSSCIFTPEG